MGSLPAPCPGDHWPRGCGDGSAGGPQPGPLRVVLPSCQAQAMAEGPVALRGDAAALVDAPSLRVAAVVPSFRRGSGGHATIANLLRGLEAARARHERLGP